MRLNAYGRIWNANVVIYDEVVMNDASVGTNGNLKIFCFLAGRNNRILEFHVSNLQTAKYDYDDDEYEEVMMTKINDNDQ